MSKPNTPAEALRFVENAGATLINDHGAIALDILRTTIRRDWAVRVLDAACPIEEDFWQCYRMQRGRAEVEIQYDGDQAWYHGDDLGDARHVAALAVFPTLPPRVRADLGECP